MTDARRNGFAASFSGRARVEALGPIEARRRWLLFLDLARDHARRALEGAHVDSFEATQFRGYARLGEPFPAQSPACAQDAAKAAQRLACALVTAGDPTDRADLARILVGLLDFLAGVIDADTDRRAAFTRRITGERED